VKPEKVKARLAKLAKGMEGGIKKSDLVWKGREN